SIAAITRISSRVRRLIGGSFSRLNQRVSLRSKLLGTRAVRPATNRGSHFEVLVLEYSLGRPESTDRPPQSAARARGPILPSSLRTQGPIPTGRHCFCEVVAPFFSRTKAAEYGSLRSQGRPRGRSSTFQCAYGPLLATASRSPFPSARPASV